MLKLIVGLGNPGQQYQRTRHNVGFWFVDILAAEHNADWQLDKKFNGQLATIELNEKSITLMKPLTFMNKSGSSVSAYVRYYQLNVEDVLVVHDELDFLPGVARLKKNGGHAGHNGLRDIIAQLNSNDFPRLRIGIGRPPGRQAVADYVLSAPSKDDQEKIESASKGVLSRLNVLFGKDLDHAMNELHG